MPGFQDFSISTGNKGVDQLVIKNFSKCGITAFVFTIILALFCMTGCLEKAPQLLERSSTGLQDQPANPQLQMDFDVELKSDLFSVQGDIMLPGNSSLAYLMLNATLCQGQREQFSTKYLLMQIEPNLDYGFEITKNAKIPAGEYDCILEAKGSQGVLARASRKVSLAESREQMAFEQVPWPVELDEEFSGQKVVVEEEWPEEESLPSKEMQAATEVVLNEAHDPANAEDGAAAEPAAMAGEESGSDSAGASLQASSTLPEEQKGKFMGSITSKKYHRPDCRYALKIKPENRIYFQNMEEAKEQGYLPCKICNP